MEAADAEELAKIGAPLAPILIGISPNDVNGRLSS